MAATKSKDWSKEIVIGLLEQFRYKQYIRVAFHKQGAVWTAFPNNFKSIESLQDAMSKYPEEMEWIVSQRGKRSGTIISFQPSLISALSEAGLHMMKMGEDIPSSGDLTEEFSGNAGKPCARPLVCSSQSMIADPDGWKRVRSTAGLVRACQPAFKVAVKDLYVVSDSGKKAKLKYKEGMAVVHECWAAKDGTIYLSLKISGNMDKLSGYQVPAGAPEWEPQGFMINPKGKATWLGSGLRFVDAGDYDKDGRSEVIFFYTRGNSDGYAMYHSGFSKAVSFSWSY
jgi:hypothetical protein